jgi:hypothetical protein
MFTIEYVIVRDRAQPAVVERMSSAAERSVVALNMAKALFAKVHAERNPPPDGYQILDNSGAVALRSWKTRQ